MSNNPNFSYCPIEKQWLLVETNREAFAKREEGSWNSVGKSKPVSSIKPSRPDPKKIALAVAPIMRGVSTARMKALDEIARLAGEKPATWEKPQFGDFEYWLANNCGWISNEELKADTDAYFAKSQLARETSHRFSQQRFSWMEQPRYKEPKDTGEYVPEINMKLVRDRNLTDSSRRIAMFVMRHAYQDNREQRLIGMTVSFIMKGLSLSRRTVQRSLTLLETRGYFRCTVATNEETKMCVGLIIRLSNTLFPKHHQRAWPKRRKNSGASAVPHNQQKYIKKIYGAKKRVSRMSWAIKCMNGVARCLYKTDPAFGKPTVPECRGFKAIGTGILLQPKIRTLLC